MGATWIMKFGQSAEDGTMPLLQCCVGEGVASGEFIEPSRMGNMKGEPAVVPLAKRGAKEIEPAATNLLWEVSEKAVGEWKVCRVAARPSRSARSPRGERPSAS